MNSKDENQNPWLTGGVGSILTLIEMLVDLDRRGILPTDMRDASVMHADALLDVLPGYIEYTSNTLAAAHAERTSGENSFTTSQVCWGISFMTSALTGMVSLAAIKREREECPEIYAAYRKSCGSNIKLASDNAKGV